MNDQGNMRVCQWKKWKVLILVMSLIIIDQILKEVAIVYLKNAPVYSFFGDTFRLQYAENKGAFLSLGSDLSTGFRFWILGVVVFVFLSFYAYQLLKSQPQFLVKIGISLVLGGGISNLIDRFFRSEGSVIDFMNVGIGGLRTGIFNLADMAILAGVILLLYDSWVSKNKEKQKS